MAGEFMDSDSCHDAIVKGDSIRMKKFNLFRNVRMVVVDAIRLRGGSEFQFASKELRADHKLCERAITNIAGLFVHEEPRNNGFHLQYASNELKANRGLYETAMMNTQPNGAWGFGLEKFPKSIREDKDLMLTFHNKHGDCFPHVGKTLQADKEFVHHILATEGWQLKHASPELKDDKDTVLLALAKSDSPYQYCSARLQADKEVCLRSIDLSPSNVRYFPQEIRNLIGKDDPVAVLTKAINAEKLSERLNMKLQPKTENRQQSMKMKI